MTTHAGDMLTYAQELESTGLARDQAVIIARGSASMLEQRFETLATRADPDAVGKRRDSLQLRPDALGRLEELPVKMRVHTRMLAVLPIAVGVPRIQRWLAL